MFTCCSFLNEQQVNKPPPSGSARLYESPEQQTRALIRRVASKGHHLCERLPHACVQDVNQYFRGCPMCCKRHKALRYKSIQSNDTVPDPRSEICCREQM